MAHMSPRSSVPEGAIPVIAVIGGEPLAPADVAAPSREQLETIGFQGTLGNTLMTVIGDRPCLLVGLGDDASVDDVATAAVAVGRAAPAGSTVAMGFADLDLVGVVEAAVRGVEHGLYRFEEYRSGDVRADVEVVLVGVSDPSEELRYASAVAHGETLARDWVNTPAADKAPVHLAEEIGEALIESGYEVEIWDEDRIVEERLGGLSGVAAGSSRAPRMVVAHRSGDGPHLCVVGKGIVFDSGGLSIKSAENMMTMKYDMAGAAAVAGAAVAIGRLDLATETSVFLPLTDNMSGGNATKPGDVLRIRNGKTIEVLNTDAEGRLVLADALSLASERHPSLIVDVATLTGASRVAVGSGMASLFADDDRAADLVATAAARAGERVWRMPLEHSYRNLIDSTIADMKNTGGRYGGAILAALLLAEFVDDVPWVHLDIAGPGWRDTDSASGAAGGTGFGVGTLVAVAHELARE